MPAVEPFYYNWLFPDMSRPNHWWNIKSTMAIAAVGTFAKVVVTWLNNLEIHNKEALLNALEKRHPKLPLITVMNHHSCLDDPGLWGLLPMRLLTSPSLMRWSLAAHDICYTNRFVAAFFCIGQSIPVVRGYGVYQKAMDFCVEQLNRGKWVNIFPEGRVNLDKVPRMRYKWGVGRLIADARECPLVLPMYHLGMDSVLPNRDPYIPRIGNKVTLVIGEPISFRELRKKLREEGADAKTLRKTFTDRVEDEMDRLRRMCEVIHFQRQPS